VKALDIYRKLTKEIDEKIEGLFGTRPKTGVNFKTFQPLPARR